MKDGDRYYSRRNMHEVIITSILEQYVIYKTEGLFGFNTGCATLEEFKRDFSTSYKEIQLEHITEEIDTIEKKIAILNNQLYLTKEVLVSILMAKEES